MKYRFNLAATAAAMMLIAGAAVAGACGDKATTTAEKGKACCAKKGAASASAHPGCSGKSEAITTAQVGDVSDVKTCTFRPGSVAFKGTVVCNHCDLKKTETCQTMFKTENGCLFALAGDNVKQIKEEAGGGSKLVRIKGTVSDDGQLTVGTYRIVKTLASSTSAM